MKTIGIVPVASRIRSASRRVDEDGIRSQGDEFASHVRIERAIEVADPHVDAKVAAFDETVLREPLDDHRTLARDRGFGAGEEKPDAPGAPGLLRARSVRAGGAEREQRKQGGATLRPASLARK